MNYCSECGVKVHPESKFCPQCGFDFQSKVQSNYRKKTGIQKMSVNESAKINVNTVTKLNILFFIISEFSKRIILITKRFLPFVAKFCLYVFILACLGYFGYSIFIYIKNDIQISDNLSSSKQWRLKTATDPSTGKLYGYGAYITSEDGKCSLEVQHRLDNTRITDISCVGVKLNNYSIIKIKFSNISELLTLSLHSYRDSEGVYIPSAEDFYGQKYSDSYDKFIKGLMTADKVAFMINPEPWKQGDYFWVTFNLNGSISSINGLGKEQKQN